MVAIINDGIGAIECSVCSTEWYKPGIWLIAAILIWWGLFVSTVSKSQAMLA